MIIYGTPIKHDRIDTAASLQVYLTKIINSADADDSAEAEK